MDEVVLQQNFSSECDLKKKNVDNAPPRPPSPACYAPNLDKSGLIKVFVIISYFPFIQIIIVEFFPAEENLSVATVESREDNSLMSTSKPLRSSNRKTKRENQKK